MADKNNALNQLDSLVGEWRMEAISNDVVVASGKTTFAWLADHSFLIQHTTADPPLPATPQVWIDNSPFPIVVIISLDDPSKKLFYNYADGRGVHRVYQMSFKGKIWKVWGQAGPEFYQRFTNTFSEGGNIMTSHIEQSKDNKTWKTDFITRYTRLK